ncbi:MAG: hypothetical protein OXC37_03650 [Bdellovibrionaceae bacterium]|nr:hypothetical protein [Pseudobdellovibrionaceae bacterium]
MKRIVFVLILFFIGAFLEVSALDSQYSIAVLQKFFLAKNITNNQISIKSNEDNNSSQQENNINVSSENINSKSPIKSNEDNSSSQQDNERKVSSSESVSYSCTEVWTDKFSFGYVQVGSTCDPDKTVCIAFFQIERNYCEGDKLVRFYCDPKSRDMYAEEKITCEKGCGTIDYSSACIK